MVNLLSLLFIFCFSSSVPVATAENNNNLIFPQRDGSESESKNEKIENIFTHDDEEKKRNTLVLGKSDENIFTHDDEEKKRNTLVLGKSDDNIISRFVNTFMNNNNDDDTEVQCENEDDSDDDGSNVIISPPTTPVESDDVPPNIAGSTTPSTPVVTPPSTPSPPTPSPPTPSPPTPSPPTPSPPAPTPPTPSPPAPTPPDNDSTQSPTTLFTGVSISCPPSSSSDSNDFVEVPANTRVLLTPSKNDELCSLSYTDLNFTTENIPLGRSYNGYDWETTVAGKDAGFEYTCQDHQDENSSSSRVCLLIVPNKFDSDDDSDTATNKLFALRSWSMESQNYNYTLSEFDLAARFLEKTSFGMTKSELIEFSDPSSYVKEQMSLSLPQTSHRALFRSQAQTRVRRTYGVGVPIHFCSRGSRWRKFAFDKVDGTAAFDYYNIEETSTEGRYLISLNGQPRAEVTSVETTSGQTFNVPGTYESCGAWEYVGGPVKLKINGVCHELSGGGNPEIKFNTITPQHVLEMTPSEVDDKFVLVPQNYDNEVDGQPQTDEFLLNMDLEDEPMCNYLNYGTFPVYISITNGTWLGFNPRLDLLKNTVENPSVTGGTTRYLQGMKCPNVERNFLNAESCVYLGSSNICSSTNEQEDAHITFTQDTILDFQQMTNRPIHVVKGLRPDIYSNPCVFRKRVRWLKIGEDEETCPATEFSDNTLATLKWWLFRDHDFSNLPNIIDTIKDVNWRDCTIPLDQNLTETPITVYWNSGCWQIIHPDELSVIDFSNWVNKHPGGPDKITQFFENDESYFHFPAHHDMSQWEDNHDENLVDVARVNETKVFRDIPSSLQTNDVIQSFFGSDEEEEEDSGGGGGGVICGSPNEVASNPFLGEFGFQLNMEDDADPTLRSRDRKQKERIWLSAVLKSPDQLRQRVAWALVQLFAISFAGSEEDVQTEGLLYYYDIFVRHAFGNFLDMLKEVSYSRLMSKMLTYFRSQSTAYVLESRNEIEFPDENYAREVMQLFTIGTDMLNIDGSKMKDENGQVIPTYSNDHIMSYARAWTGFDHRTSRGNIECVDNGNFHNSIDPMKIIPEWRDVFPKLNLFGGYIGDHSFPLCQDIKKHFLKKGAKYLVLGGNSMTMETQENIPSWWSDLPQDPNIMAFTLQTTQGDSSQLYQTLCNPDTITGNCNIQQAQITLEHDLECTGNECDVDTLRLVEVLSGNDKVYFEYVRPPCIELSYYENAQMVQLGPNRINYMCADPRLEVAGESCCSSNEGGGGDVIAEKNCEYVYERMSFETASNRCSDIGLSVCSSSSDSFSFSSENECSKFNYFYHWYDSSTQEATTACQLKVKVEKGTGYIAIVHEGNTDNINNDIDGLFDQKFKRDSVNFFPAYWFNNGNYPSIENGGSNSCDSTEGCESLVSLDGSCLCDISSVQESQVFFNAAELTSVEHVLKSLHIASSVNPTQAQQGDYDSTPSFTLANGKIKVFFHTSSSSSFDKQTIVSVQHEEKTLYLKNVVSTVVIGGGGGNTSSPQFSFRNPPHIMNFQSSTKRDAEYETDAVLDSYFYHPNTAPFLAIHFIQRFGISNPSPRYVEAVAKAFQTGVYDENESSSFGSGTYGDMSSTIAAVLLDRESTSPILDVLDPNFGSLKEPLLKVVSIMRSFEYEPVKKHQTQMMDYELLTMNKFIGQGAHDIQSVFSYFRREYSLNGNAHVKSPESEVYVAPQITGIINGLFGLIKFGLTDCWGGFGEWGDCWKTVEGKSNYAFHGRLHYEPSLQVDGDSLDLVDELSTIMTAGRLSTSKRELLREYLKEAQDADWELRLAQQFIAITPEFHSTSLSFQDDVEEEEETPQTNNNNDSGSTSSNTHPYKAIIYIFLNGGVDSYNILVPHSNCLNNKDMYLEYNTIRASMAISKNQLLQIDASDSGQVCDTFGVHPDLSIVRDLYNDGDLAFYANVGILHELGVRKSNWAHTKTNKNTQLFAHNVQQHDTQQIDPYRIVSGTGVLGRAADVLTEGGMKTGSYSIAGMPRVMQSQPGDTSPPVTIMNDGGVPVFNNKPSVDQMKEKMFYMNNSTATTNNKRNGKFGMQWSEIFKRSINDNLFFKQIIEDSVVNTWFDPNDSLSTQLKMVTRIMKQKSVIGNEREFFYVTKNDWDTHFDQVAKLDWKFPRLNDSIQSLVNELKDQNVWDQTTVIVTSEFGRTLTPNSGQGTDHAWGGNYFAFGGDVLGGKILGEYPHDITNDGELNIGRGRLIPTSPWEAPLNGIMEWMGVEQEEDLNLCLPNRHTLMNEDGGDDILWTKQQMFKS